MENITGTPVRGNDFFRRDRIIEQAWNLLKSGEHIIIAAPEELARPH
ncbi:MAG: hypothetical protein ACOC5F_04015 [Candidatus Aminicenantaceae bacterium]